MRASLLRHSLVPLFGYLPVRQAGGAQVRKEARP
jgi:hypothetical protein